MQKRKFSKYAASVSELTVPDEAQIVALGEAIRMFMQMDNLTSPLLRELIDHIDIFETEGTGKSRTQRIVIYYRFIGYIELPNTAKQTHIADTRKGVAVEYITEQFTA